MANWKDVNVLIGKVITEIKNKDNDELYFLTSEGEVYKMFHYQDCCESVSIEEIIGSLDDLLDSPITMAEETSETSENDWGSETWTFYKFATNKGYVTIRWFGESNGYYSESVDFVQLQEYEIE
jgi:hypothetical protein